MSKLVLGSLADHEQKLNKNIDLWFSIYTTLTLSQNTNNAHEARLRRHNNDDVIESDLR